MAVNADFAGRTYPPSGPYAVDAARSRRSPPPSAPAPCTPTPRPRGRPATATSSRRRRSPCASPAVRAEIHHRPGGGHRLHPRGPRRAAFVHHRPITAGDAVVGTTTVDAVRSAGGHAMVTTRTELATDGRRGARDVHVHRSSSAGGGVSMAVRPLAEVSVGDVVGPVTVPSHARRSSPTRTPPSTRTPSTRTRPSPARSACPT